jgi:tRNA(fMet)-specific endonuclease VapC
VVALIDTSIFVAVERDHLKLSGAGLSPSHECAISAITASELLHGVWRARDLNIRSKRERFVEDILSAFAVIPFDLAVARVHAELSARLAGSGIRVGEADLMVAATAISIGAPIATLDPRSFPRIPGISLLPVKI